MMPDVYFVTVCLPRHVDIRSVAQNTKTASIHNQHTSYMYIVYTHAEDVQSASLPTDQPMSVKRPPHLIFNLSDLSRVTARMMCGVHACCVRNECGGDAAHRIASHRTGSSRCARLWLKSTSDQLYLHSVRLHISSSKSSVRVTAQSVLCPCEKITRKCASRKLW